MLVLVGALLGLTALLLGILVLWRLRPGSSHGSAAFGAWPSVSAAQLSELPPGLVLGKTTAGAFAGWATEGHWLVMAPTGAGKSTGVLMPSITGWRGSLAAIDIKGELARACAPQLQANGIDCVRIDPFGVLNDTDLEAVGIDPVGEAAGASDTVEGYKALAEILVDPGQGSDEHWAQSARLLTSGLIAAAAVAKDEANRSLAAVNGLAVKGAPYINQLAKYKLPEPENSLLQAANQLLRDAGTNERGAVISTVRRQLDFLGNEKVAAALRGSWSPASLLDASKPTALFIVLPPEYLGTQARLLRVVIGGVVQAMLAAGTSRTRRLLFVLDEAAALGSLEAVSRGIGLFRGFGASFLLSFQDVGQLEATYGKRQARSIQANCHALYWACRDQATCEAVAAQLGDQTVLAASRKLDDLPLTIAGASTLRETGRPLLSAAEIRRLPRDQLLALVAGAPPAQLRLLPPGSHAAAGSLK